MLDILAIIQIKEQTPKANLCQEHILLHLILDRLYMKHTTKSLRLISDMREYTEESTTYYLGEYTPLHFCLTQSESNLILKRLLSLMKV